MILPRQNKKTTLLKDGLRWLARSSARQIAFFNFLDAFQLEVDDSLNDGLAVRIELTITADESFNVVCGLMPASRATRLTLVLR